MCVGSYSRENGIGTWPGVEMTCLAIEHGVVVRDETSRSSTWTSACGRQRHPLPVGHGAGEERRSAPAGGAGGTAGVGTAVGTRSGRGRRRRGGRAEAAASVRRTTRTRRPRHAENAAAPRALMRGLPSLGEQVADLLEVDLGLRGRRGRRRSGRELLREPVEGKDDQEVEAGRLDEERDHGVEEVADPDGADLERREVRGSARSCR